MKEKINSLFDKNSKKIIELGTKLYENPEIGYKEFKTKEILKNFLSEIEITDYKEFAITGMKMTIGKGNGLHIGLLCDMDALPTVNHPLATNEDNVAHSCGHNAQMTIMAGALKVIAESSLLDDFNGKVSIITAPAEEFVDFDYRKNLMKEGKIKAFSGKQNLIIDGAFDDIDIVISSHGNNLEGNKIETDISNNGFLAKTAIFKGKSSHAGAYPHMGKNALNAAVLSLNAVGLLRETFQDDHHVRFHPIIKEGGNAVNTVPDRVVVETYVRAANVDAIFDANEKINNAFTHCAKALGCECQIEDLPGYLPSNYFSSLAKYIVRNAESLVNKEDIISGGKTFASDDLADVSSIVPVIQIGFSGFSGDFHGANFSIKDPTMAYLIPSKLVALIVLDMLTNKDEVEKDLENFRPIFTKEEYIENWLS